MSMRAIVGLLAVNLVVILVGFANLYALRGWRSWGDLARFVGLAYFVGLSILMVVLTAALVTGLTLGASAMAVVCVTLIAAGVGVGASRGRPMPAYRPLSAWRGFPPMPWIVAVFGAAIVVYLEALFRAARLSPIVDEFDGWAFWVPKAQAIHYFGRLETEFLSLLPYSTGAYPPGVPVVHAVVFHGIGDADVVTLHVQYWVYLAAFVLAVVGTLDRDCAA